MIEKTCLFCGAENNCMAYQENPCWCSKIEVPKELLALVPEDLKRKACICFGCIQKFKANSGDFIHDSSRHEEEMR